jgi:hypothetical protein
MKKWLGRIALVLAVVFALIQGYRPERTNPPVNPSRTLHANVDVPPAVDAILDRACNDCHSNDTHWPWYSNVAPVSWMVVEDVNEGREHMNFSEWAAYSPDDARHALEEICEEVQKGAMPMKEYTWTHREARLSDNDVSTLCTWTRSFDRARRRGRG